ncbi:MAG: SUMF1/EgtB/PvdO family nonheme iron enzyme [Acidobacteria bacterium]|nr:SUMF1/EgtB/PvdO family nonheme iron enzyme [Acidobacteriota bacterium]
MTQPTYVFLSYAKGDLAAASALEAALRAAGLRVFRDRSDIRPSDHWPLKIHQALCECERMVLLLSPHSMPYHKETFAEWFFFEQQGKPIFPLLLADCQLFYRLPFTQHMDVRGGLDAVLPQLLACLAEPVESAPPLPPAETIAIVPDAEKPVALVEAQAALAAVADAAPQPVVLTEAEAEAIAAHPPADVRAYRLSRVAAWSLPRYQLDRRFVSLTLTLDQGEEAQERFVPARQMRFNDLREVLAAADTDRALVLLGAPGGGKSTVLRRLQLDHSLDRLRDERDEISFLLPLNSYPADYPPPRQWLNACWAQFYPHLPPLESWLANGRALLLLDALNEMPHRDAAEYFDAVARWRAFVQEAAAQGNRLVFTCRSLDYSARLSAPELRVPQVQVQPMDDEQVRAFLFAYCPAHAAQHWEPLRRSAQFALYRTPYLLKLLSDQLTATGKLPAGRAALFTGFVRQALARESNAPLFQPLGTHRFQRAEVATDTSMPEEVPSASVRPMPSLHAGSGAYPGAYPGSSSDELLTEDDHLKLNHQTWRDDFDLPDDGALLPGLSALALAMQRQGQERLAEAEARRVLAQPRSRDVLKAGLALGLLDKDLARAEIGFFHQLLREYFAARQLAQAPDAALAHVEWEAARVTPSLTETLAGLASNDPLPPLAQTGWEETLLTAAPMLSDVAGFIRELLPHNLPLAGRCAAAPDVTVGAAFKRELQDALIQRAQDFKRADLRARIAAGEALGQLGDARFTLRQGAHGAYLLPPLVTIAAGEYPIGLNQSDYEDETPQIKVRLAAFEIGQFPVTNAEYAHFIAARGYEDEQWWDTAEARAWRSGESTAQGEKGSWRDFRKQLQSYSEDELRGMVQTNRATPDEVDDWLETRNWSDKEFEQWLDDEFPPGTFYREPRYWNDARFNQLAQPVVGVSWFEARAYGKWLTANVADGRDFRLPTEFEFEAAARGQAGRLFPYGNKFDKERGNTFESHLRRTTPVGIFDNATPEKAYDLTGNAYTWTLSLYDQQRFGYRQGDVAGRDDIHATNVKRVLRGGSWIDDGGVARSVYRNVNLPGVRFNDSGFRVVVVRPPS